ncbi:L,D-transpeptidase family protein [Compostibacter hankyongensis]|uniref:L,D-TPase catalytic domain-containing protein n=1 Tax=Compostibacter hankyongensis TaxID=1007089 RepID=A0ABP8FQA0_9BACT
MKQIGVLLALCWAVQLHGQSFMQQQMHSAKFREAYAQKEFELRKAFAAKGLTYPARYIYLRSFKYDSELEVWVKNAPSDTFTLFKRYRVCALSGTMGPKRREGDRQVPEGFYYVNEFNPNSLYHLSLGLNYPNFSDRLHGDKETPGGGIYIHGSCVTVGCIPLTNPQVEEVYLLAAHARSLGQDYIPVHIFPIRFNNKRSLDYLGSVSLTDDVSQRFWLNLKKAYDYFEETHELPVVMFDSKGNYVLQEYRPAPNAAAKPAAPTAFTEPVGAPQ